MIEVVTDVSSLHPSEMGNITGQVFLRGPAGDFPESRWSDFPVVILRWWIEGLTAVVAGKNRSFQGMFMDGPFAFVVQRDADTAGRIAWGQTGKETSLGIVDLTALLRSAVTAGRQVADACRSRQWHSRDLDNLERAIASSAV
jgi:hypothetical protein